LDVRFRIKAIDWLTGWTCQVQLERCQWGAWPMLLKYLCYLILQHT
jgi:hypothetical protein